MQIKAIFEYDFLKFVSKFHGYYYFRTEGVRINLKTSLHCLAKDISHFEFFKTTNFLENWKFNLRAFEPWS